VRPLWALKSPTALPRFRHCSGVTRIGEPGPPSPRRRGYGQ
jgi:hypothetical protein